MITVRVYTVLSNLHVEVQGTAYAATTGGPTEVRQLSHAVIQSGAEQSGQRIIEHVTRVLQQVEGYASDISHYVQR